MNLTDLGEFGLISRIRKLSRHRTSSATVGIGDDAAALKFAAARDVLATTDLLIQDVHFDLSCTDYYSLGWKSAAVNLSDIAAMGAVPRFCLTALGIPRTTRVEQVLEFYRGFEEQLRRAKTELVGGDTCASPKALFISVTILGQARRSEIVTRSGARPGDLIFVTGSLGDSAAGLDILKQGMHLRPAAATDASRVERLVEKHLRPEPRTSEGRMIALTGCASAMIDLSDGLSSDLGHICEESRTGAVIEADRIPLSPALTALSARLGADALEYALSGGEDYELLFTVPPRKLRRLEGLGLPVTRIGVVTRGRRVLLKDSEGRTSALPAAGYNHFAEEGRLRGHRQTAL